MPAADYFSKVYQRLTTTLSADKGIGASSMTLNSATNWPTTTGVKASVYTLDSNGEIDPSTLCVYRGQVSGSSITSLTLVEGTDQLHSAGAVVSLLFTATHWNDLVDGLTATALDQDGTLKAGAVDTTAVLADGVVTNAKMATDVKPYTLMDENTFDHVASGCVWTGDAYGSTRAASMTSGVVYINGQRVAINLVSARTFTASRDTYVDVGTDGVIDYNEVTNNAASPALASGHVRLAIIVTGASNIANVGSINQGEEFKVLPIRSSIPMAVTDELGNLICPRDPNRRILGYRQILANATTTSNGTYVQITGLAVPVIVPANRKIRITFGATMVTNQTSGITSILSIFDGTVPAGTPLCQRNYYPSVANASVPAGFSFISSPSSSSKVYNGAFQTSGVGTAFIDASAGSPAFLLVELV